MLKAIVFDFDGVMMDSEPLHYQAFVELGRGIGVEMTPELYAAEYIGFDDRDAFRVMLESTGQAAPPGRIAELCEAKRPAFEAVTRAAAQRGEGMIPGAVELLDAAKSAGLRVAVASGATRADIDLMLGILDRRDAFETIVTADDVERSKPDPASYALAVRRLGLAPADCMAIEDTPAGIASAKGAGLRVLAVMTTHPAEALRDADRVATGMDAVSVEELKAWFGGAAGEV